MAHSYSTGHPSLPQQQQQAGIDALYQQLQHHSGASSSSGEPPVGSSSSSGRSLVLAGAAAVGLGYCGLLGLPLPGLEQPAAVATAADGQAANANGQAANGNSSSSSGEPPLLQVLFGLCSSKDSRAVLRAVSAVGYIGAGSNSEQLKLAAAKGESGATTE